MKDYPLPPLPVNPPLKMVQMPLEIPQKYKTAFEQILRHLVFTNQNTIIEFNYSDFYSNDEEWTSFTSMNTLTNIIKNKKERCNCFQSFSEGLHMMLKKSFSLEPQLFIVLCKNINLSSTREDALKDDCKNLNSTLIHWIYCLTMIHEELLPYSRILFQSERELGRSMTLAETAVMLKDQQILRVQDGSTNYIPFLEWISGKEIQS